MNRREFIVTAAAIPVVVALPAHRHHYRTDLYRDAYVCSCGKVKTGLEVFSEGLDTGIKAVP